jgi:hypothetical protein
LEKAVLAAVADNGATLESLRATFRVHERLLVEATVTLITAGWIAVVGGSETRFVLTAAGGRAIDSNHDPVSVTVSPANPQIIVMERIAGQVAHHSEARSWRQRDLGELAERAVIIRERVSRNALDEAQVQKLLPRNPGHWVRRIGPIALTSRRTHFLPVEVDLAESRVRGLPPAWQAALRDRVLNFAHSVARIRGEDSSESAKSRYFRDNHLFSKGRPIQTSSVKRDTKLQVSAQDFLLGTQRHEDELSRAIASARTSIAITSPEVDRSSFLQVIERISDAIRRGVHVDLLFGRIAGDVSTKELLAIANKAGYDADPNGGRARLRLRGEPTGSGASVLVYDIQEGELVSLIGDYPWLSTPVEGAPSTGLVLRNRSLSADLARAIATMWTGRGIDQARWSAQGERWRGLATTVEDQAAADEVLTPTTEVTTDSTAELLVDEEIVTLDLKDQPTIRVGGSTDDPTGGAGGVRGLVLRLTGHGAETIKSIYLEQYSLDA